MKITIDYTCKGRCYCPRHMWYGNSGWQHTSMPHHTFTFTQRSKEKRQWIKKHKQKQKHTNNTKQDYLNRHNKRITHWDMQVMEILLIWKENVINRELKGHGMTAWVNGMQQTNSHWLQKRGISGHGLWTLSPVFNCVKLCLVGPNFEPRVQVLGSGLWRLSPMGPDPGHGDAQRPGIAAQNGSLLGHHPPHKHTHNSKKTKHHFYLNIISHHSIHQPELMCEKEPKRTTNSSYNKVTVAWMLQLDIKLAIKMAR